MGYPMKYKNQMLRALHWSKIGLLDGTSLEVVLPFFLRNLEFNYLEKIGVCGYIGNANGKEFISE